MKKPVNKIAYTLTEIPFGGGTAIQIRIVPVRVKSISDLIEEAVDNKIGYSDPSTAVAYQRLLEDLQRQGYQTLYELDSYHQSYAPITLQWIVLKGRRQHGPSVGQADIEELGERGYSKTRKAMTLLERIGRAVQRRRFKKMLERQGREAYSDEKPDKVSDRAFSDPSELMRVMDGMNFISARWYRPTGPFTSFLLERREPREWIVTDSLRKTFELHERLL